MKYPQNRYFLYAVISALVILFLLSSCSCNYHLKQAEKKCGKTVIHDTLIVRDSIKVELVKTDTIFKSKLSDTVYIDKDRLHIKYVRLPGDSVFISGKCDPVTKYVIIRVPYEKVVVAETWEQWFKRNSLWLFLIAIAVMVTAVLLKKFVFP